jgi:type II secretory pathway pseudopilin PulG
MYIMALKINKFSKEEFIAVFVIFSVLIGVSVPNFVSSLRRARNQTRKDDMGMISKVVDKYKADFGSYPLSTDDGRFLACLKPGSKVEVGKDGRLIADLIPCEWGKDSLVDLTPGSTKVYAERLPNDPHAEEQGVSYKYFSDGSRYQIFASLEGTDDAEYDPSIIAREISCGPFTCNLGRGYGCEPVKTLAQCEEEQLRELKERK